VPTSRALIAYLQCSDDFWPLSILRKSFTALEWSPLTSSLRGTGRNASMMQVFSIHDPDNKEAIQTSIDLRRSSHREKETIETVREAVSIVGGRLSHLRMVSRARDMLEMANHLKTVEKGWLLSRIGLIQDCDSDVLEEVRAIPEPTFVMLNARILAKVEFLLLGPLE